MAMSETRTETRTEPLAYHCCLVLSDSHMDVQTLRMAEVDRRLEGLDAGGDMDHDENITEVRANQPNA